MVFFSWLNTNNAYLPSGLSFCNAYLWFSLVMAIVVFACLAEHRRRQAAGAAAKAAGATAGSAARRSPDRQNAVLQALDVAACLGMAASSALVVSPALFGWDAGCALVGSIVAGLGIGWSYVRWAICLSHCELRDLIRFIFVGCIVWTAGRTIAFMLPLAVSTAFAAAIPLVSGLMLAAMTHAGPGGALGAAGARPLGPKATGGTAGCGTASGVPAASSGAAAPTAGSALSHPHDGSFSTWKLWVVIVVLTLNNQLILGGTMPYAGDLSGVYPIKASFTVAISCLVLVWTLRTNLAFDFVLLWRGLYMLAAAALLIISLGFEGPVLWVASSVAADMLVPILWLTICTVAHHTPIPSYFVVGVGLGAYGVASFAGQLIGRTVPALLGLAPLCTVLLFVLFVVLALCLDSRNPDLLQLFDDLRGRQLSPTDLEAVNARCAEVGSDHRLTPREVEVMQMLCAGRSRSYIAETLFISENTVKTHSDRLYKKLGVHSREELQGLVGL